jgi:transcriptional regulator with XRE-family HTH domain
MKIDLGSSIGGVLRQARLDLGLAQGDLAERLGVSITILNRVEHGKRRFDTDWMENMPPSLRSAVKGALSREVQALSVFRRSEDEVETEAQTA